jgi:integrase/recombinase XerD
MNTNTPTVEETFVSYLRRRRYTAITIKNKLGQLKIFFQWLKKENLLLNHCGYSDMMAFVQHMRKENFSIPNQNLYLRAIRQLYEGLMLEEMATHNPVANLKVRGHVYRLPHNILSSELLQKIYDGYKPTTDYQIRNKAMLGLYINQALMRADVNGLEVRDINLIKGTIRIRKNIKLAERILSLAAHQVLTLQEYISKIRPQLLKQSEFVKGDRLFFTYASGQTVNESLRQLLHVLKKKHLELTSLHQIRTSVLANWAKEKPIREAQYLAGHTHLRSIQRYRDIDLQDLQESLNEYHPLKK